MRVEGVLFIGSGRFPEQRALIAGSFLLSAFQVV